MAPPDVLWWAFWGLLGSPFMLRGCSYGVSASSGLFGGGFGVSSHLQACPVSLRAPSIFRHVERTWGGSWHLPVFSESLKAPVLSHAFLAGTFSKLGAWTLPPLEFEALTGGLELVFGHAPAPSFSGGAQGHGRFCTLYQS